MRIFPPQIEIGDEEGFTEEKDIFKLKEFGEALTSVVEKVEDPMVIVLDGPWGDGKTTFAKMWLGELRKKKFPEKKFPVIYFDAFANDFMDDAFVAIAGEVISLLPQEKLGDKGDNAYKTFLDKAVKVGKIVARSSKVGALSLDVIDAVKSESSSEKKSEWMDTHLKTLLQSHKEERSAIKEFKKALSEIASKLVSSDSDDLAKEEKRANCRPLVFVIDELDRCKPSFALAVLERIKHFFSVEGIHFVLVTNLKQLEKSVESSYGKIDAQIYLQKFYNLVFSLPEERGVASLANKTSVFLRRIFSQFPDDDENDKYKSGTLKCLEGILINQSYSLRTIEKIGTRIALVIAMSTKSEYRNSALIAGLCVLKVVKPELYNKAKNGILTLDEIKGSLRFDLWVSSEYIENLWTFCLADELPEDVTDWDRFTSIRMDIGIDNRKEIIPILCQRIDLI